ncbi:MAG: 2-dehydro-3-deoxygluconokinase [Ignavibacteriae bacterium]|nr:MAG: 2-dehydro-3-deoxygluconokinase [Ignavibacteriota bacterium]
MNKKVVTFGEIMLRLSTPSFQRFVQTNTFDVNYGGGEANVAVSLANYGLDSFFISKLPKHEIGQSAINQLRKYGVNTENIIRGGERLGTYFLEIGASQRASKVIYDRASSSITTSKLTDFNWDIIFENTSWFHWTGISAALGPNVVEIIEEACKVAKSKNVKISCDLNFRKKLWSKEKAQETMKPLMEYVDVCIANEEDSEKSLGLKINDSDIESGKLNKDAYYNVVTELKKIYKFEIVAITLRESFSASRNGWSAVMLDNSECKDIYHSNRYDIHIVDRVGGGDSFASGLIYGLLSKNNSKEALEFAVAASCLKHTIPGDFNLVSKEEVENLINGSGSGRVER